MATQIANLVHAESNSQRIALLFRALNDLDREKAEYMTEHKERRTKLENQLAALVDETLSNQVPLPLEQAGD